LYAVGGHLQPRWCFSASAQLNFKPSSLEQFLHACPM